jgi:tryptophan synthase alpha chain
VSEARRRLRRATVESKRPFLVCYLPVGDPQAAVATPALYAESGVDILECGIGVADPILDGPTVATSMRRAIDAGVSGQAGADYLVEQLDRGGNPPSVWMSYQPHPDDSYISMVAAAGVGGVLLPDAAPLPSMESASDAGIDFVPFVNHRPRPDQLAAASRAGSYTMVAAADGVTGERSSVGQDNAALLAGLRERGLKALALGFGIGNAKQARRAIDLGADGVVVGSACILAAAEGADSLSALLSSLRAAVDA